MTSSSYFTAASIRALIAKGGDLDKRASGGAGPTPLEWAVTSSDAALVDELIAAGASPQVAMQSSSQLSAVHRAAECAPLTSAKLLRSLLAAAQARGTLAAAVSATCTIASMASGITPLHFAAKAGGLEAVEVLLEAGAPPNAIAVMAKSAARRIPAEWATSPNISGRLWLAASSAEVSARAGAPRPPSTPVAMPSPRALDSPLPSLPVSAPLSPATSLLARLEMLPWNARVEAPDVDAAVAHLRARAAAAAGRTKGHNAAQPHAQPTPAPGPVCKESALLRLLAADPHCARALSQLARDMPTAAELVVPGMGAAAVGPRSIIERALSIDDEDADALSFLAHLVPPGRPYALPDGRIISSSDLFIEAVAQRYGGTLARKYRLRADVARPAAAPATAAPAMAAVPGAAALPAAGQLAPVVPAAGNAPSQSPAFAPVPPVTAAAPAPDHAALAAAALAALNGRVDANARESAAARCFSPAHFAASRDRSDVLEALASRGESVSACDAAGDTPLHVAVRSGSVGAASMLLETLRVPWHHVNQRGETFADVPVDATRALVAKAVSAVRTNDDAEAPERVWVAMRLKNRAALGALAALGSAMDELIAMAGMANKKGAKWRALDIVRAVLLDKTRPPEARTSPGARYNWLFTGNPGTGKTTVARLFARLLTQLGLRGAAMRETLGVSLKHDGLKQFDTAIAALVAGGGGGGTLFIDEIHAVNPAAGGETRLIYERILDVAENRRTELSIIGAGYGREVQAWLEADSGMASRFDIVEFEDFDEDMLRDTIIACVSKAKWSLAPPPPGAREGLDTARIAARRIARGRNSPNFSNARSARTFVDAAFQRANARLAGASADFSAVANSTTLEASDVLGAPFHESSSRALRALDAMTGLAPVKAAVRGFVHAITENRTAELRGEPTLDLSLHRLFVGNPGTGKTESAKLYGRILRELSLLSDGECVVRGSSSLVGGHEGATKVLVNSLMDSVKGKVLLIDEAHQLADSAYGKEALGVLVERVQGGVEDFAVIMCGYEGPMRAMLRSCDPGLARRFRPEEAFVFPDYSNEELTTIMLQMAPREGVSISKDIARRAVDAVLTKQRMKPGFGNAGAVRNLLQAGKARRLARGGALERDALTGCVVLGAADLFDVVRTEDALDVLEGLVGAAGIREHIRKLQMRVELAMSRAKQSGDSFDPSPFLKSYAFVGPPGTGKSTVARAFGEVFAKLGILAGADVVERKASGYFCVYWSCLFVYSRVPSLQASDLIGTHQNQSAPLVNAAMDEALGGVLIIDEVGGLAAPPSRSMAHEVVEALLANLTHPKYKNKLLVIVADYPHNVDRLFRVNAGMRSRFTERIEFAPSSPQDCVALVKRTVECAPREELPPGAEELLLEVFADLAARDGWANSRDVLAFLAAMKEARDDRTPASATAILPLSLDDIRAAHAEPAFSARKKTADLSAGPGAGSLFAFDDHGSFPHIDDFGAEGAGTAAVLARQLSRAVAAVVDRVGATQAKDSEGGGSSGAGGGSGSSGDVRRVTRAALTEGTPRAHVEGDDGDDSDTYPLYRALADAGYEPEDALAVLQSEDIPDAIVDIIRDRSRVRPEATAARASARAQCKHLLATTQRVVAELREERERQRVAEAEAAERRLLEEELARQAAEDAEARAELERVQALREEAERRRAAELAAARQLEAARQTKLRRLGTCSMGYPWRRVAGGYVCAGGSHSFLDAQIDAYAE